MTRVQFPKQATTVMVDVDMSPMPLKVIGRQAYLQAKGLSRLLRDLGPKKRPNTLWKEKSKEIKNSMEMENGGVHRKRYDACYIN